MICYKCGKEWQCNGFNKCPLINYRKNRCKCDDCTSEIILKNMPFRCREDMSKVRVVFT